VLALGVEETAAEESSPEVEDDESSLDVDVPASYGSSLAALLEPVVVVVVVAADVVAFFATLASAGSSPSWTRRARTPKTATKLASAPAAKRRTLGTRRRGRGLGLRGCGGVGSAGMTSGSTADLKSS